MAKSLIVCSDGTMADSSSHTNVLAMKEALSRKDQLCYYDAGVGTLRSASWWNNLVDKIGGGAFGGGLSHNVQEAYRWIVDNYEEGDSLYFFGWSRGAFTVRSVVAMIDAVGLIRPPATDILIGEAFKAYSSRVKGEGGPDQALRMQFMDEHRVIHARDLDLRMLGVWDTVGSMGVPVVGPRSLIAQWKWGFHDVKLSPHVKQAFQALALDEQRAPFLPTLWESDDTVPARPVGEVEQRWFAGYHADLGGVDGRHPLAWMMQKARLAGLRFKNSKLEEEQRLELDKGPELHDSMSFFWRWIGGRIERAPGSPNGMNQTVDPSILAVKDYHPGNLSWDVLGPLRENPPVVVPGQAYPAISLPQDLFHDDVRRKRVAYGAFQAYYYYQGELT
jgi:uncharacterized protein (DUF2235 family)